MHQFDKTYWEDHWAPATAGQGQKLPVNPYLPAETIDLPIGTALDAGCGAGTEALWLAERGWQVTGADISATALTTAQARTADAGIAGRIEWVEADLARWQPKRQWDLVITNYAHPETGQLALYQRIASWVVPGGSLLIVGHLHGDEHRGHAHPEGATATLAEITDLFPAPNWRIETSCENTRTVHPGGRAVQLRDVIVRVHRLT
ncbi:class I SAM-dependent methyltransferase [Nesterenkonia muleiensis]|uniref:class I SAM-dependent methyltransferase n=1 Tax=Nesterenkonia muleiensis TaxID=2282648 RepID=UPI000E77163E|nr:class I SAM-dependent methyltransferase [Nesterenkonia muleiensis]